MLKSRGLMDDSLLTSFVRGFLGYGNLDAPLWFVGMEEGGGHSSTEITARLDAWVAHGRALVVDVESFGSSAKLAEHARWFAGERPPLQRTWSKLIRVQLARLGRPPETEAVRAYQRDEFARAGGHECVMELLPLPSPGLSEWHFGNWSELPWLASRDSYREHLVDDRCKQIRELIDDHQPEFVVFYGLNYRDHWEAIAGVRLQSEPAGWLSARRGAVKYVCTQHPVAYGATNQYFADVGAGLRG